jgi:hypothetical protein
MIKGNSSLRNLSEMPSEPIAFDVMPVKAARHSSPEGQTNHKKKSAKSSALISNEEKSDESQKPILRKFDQRTLGGKAG